MRVAKRYRAAVEALLAHLRAVAPLDLEARRLTAKVEADTATGRERQRLGTVLRKLEEHLARLEAQLGAGPVASRIARSQLALIRMYQRALAREKQKRRAARRGTRRC